MTSLRPPRLIDERYEVQGTLGEGGMAVVLAARDRRLERDVAIKMLRPQLASDPRVCERFGREAHAAATLNHPNIIKIHDVGLHMQTPYIVMELVPGQTLKQIIAKEAPFHPDDVAALMGQIAKALDHAHAKGYIHRDVKPGNILVDPLGRALVADFGIAKGLEDSDLTDAGGGFGTAAYMAPEQVLGQMATPATDIYAAGVLAFELLTGKLPFAADTPVAMAMRHVHDPPPAPSRHGAVTSSALDAVVLRALEKDPTRRWASMKDFAHALASWNTETAQSNSPSPRESPPPRTSSSLSTIVAAAVVLSALAFLIWFGMRLGDDRGNQDPSGQPSLAVIETTDEPTPVPTPTPPPTEVPAPAAQPTVAVESAPTIAPVTVSMLQAPDLRGASIPDATRALLQAGLRIAVGQSEFSSTTPMNAIISQDPPPGTTVDPGEVVRVTLSRGPSPFGANDAP